MDNTEILDFLSRLPSKVEIAQYRELRMDHRRHGSTTSLNTVGSVAGGSAAGASASSTSLAAFGASTRLRKKK